MMMYHDEAWAGALFGGFAFLIWAAMIALLVVGWWQILKKAGFHPALSLLFIVPVANLVMFLIVAFSTWPIHKGSAGYGKPSSTL